MRQRIMLVSVLGMACVALGSDEPAPPKVAVPLEPPTNRKPVSVGAVLVPAQARAGQTVSILVQARLAPGWHIYAADMPTEGAVPTTLKLRLPKGVQEQSEWIYPSAVQNPAAGGWVYEGDLTFRRALTLASDLPPGPLEVTCEFGYQACDATSCRPPAKTMLKAKGAVAARR